MRVTPSPSVQCNQRVSGKSEINPCLSIFCGQNLENAELTWNLREYFFLARFCKIFQTNDLQGVGCRSSSQNLEVIGLTGKILFSKNLISPEPIVSTESSAFRRLDVGAETSRACTALCLSALPSSEVWVVDGKVRCHIGVWKSAFGAVNSRVKILWSVQCFFDLNAAVRGASFAAR